MKLSTYSYALFIWTISPLATADLNLGDDFVTGATVSASAFNQKFSKIKKVIGQYNDSDLIGNWNCTSYKESISYVDSSHETANGGNGQVGNGYFYSNTGTVTFSETDSSTSMDSPKQWSVSRDDVLNDSGFPNGTYTLFFNLIHFFGQGQGNSANRFLSRMELQFIDNENFFLIPFSDSDSFYPNYIVCNKTT